MRPYLAFSTHRLFTPTPSTSSGQALTLPLRLDAAVAAAYGWPGNLADAEILERLLALNLERAAADNS